MILFLEWQADGTTLYSWHRFKTQYLTFDQYDSGSSYSIFFLLIRQASRNDRRVALDAQGALLWYFWGSIGKGWCCLPWSSSDTESVYLSAKWIVWLCLWAFSCSNLLVVIVSWPLNFRRFSSSTLYGQDLFTSRFCVFGTCKANPSLVAYWLLVFYSKALVSMFYGFFLL